MECCLVRKKLLSLKQKNPIGVGFERGLLTVEFTYSGHKERVRVCGTKVRLFQILIAWSKEVQTSPNLQHM